MQSRHKNIINAYDKKEYVNENIYCTVLGHSFLVLFSEVNIKFDECVDFSLIPIDSEKIQNELNKKLKYKIIISDQNVQDYPVVKNGFKTGTTYGKYIGYGDVGEHLKCQFIVSSIPIEDKPYFAEFGDSGSFCFSYEQKKRKTSNKCSWNVK